MDADRNLLPQLPRGAEGQCRITDRQIEAVQERWGGEDKVAGVAWGAKHIGAVSEFLSDRWGYVARSADWVTVYDYTK